MQYRQALIAIILMVSCFVTGCGGGHSDEPRPPVIGATSFSTDEDQTLNGQIPVTAPMGGALLLTVTAAPTHGTVTTSNPQGPSASFTYTPNANYFGSDSYSIHVVDTQSLASDATVSIAVRSVNDVPVANADTTATAPGVPVTIPVLTNDSDVETAVPQVSITTASANGVATVNADGKVTFAPNAGYAGSTSFQYQLTDEAGAKSAIATVAVKVAPLKKVIYLTGSIQNVLQYYDGVESRQVSGTCGFQSPTNPRACQRMFKAPGSRGFLFQARQTPLNFPPPNPQVSPFDVWGFYDYAQVDAALNNQANLPLVVPSVPPTITAAMFSPSGVKALVLEDVTVNAVPSSRAVLLDFLQQTKSSIHDTTGADEIRAAEFSPDGLSILYRTNAPGTDTDVTLRKVAISQPQSPVTLAGPFAAGTSARSLRPTPDGSQLLHIRTTASTSEIRAVRTDGSTTEQAVGPVVASTDGTIPGYVISPNGRYVAFVTQSSSVAPQAYLADLQANSYSPIGSAFAAGTSLSVPKFRSDSSKLMLLVTSATEVALYEAPVTNPSGLSRMSVAYPAAVPFKQFEYAGSRAVYAADPTRSGLFAIFVAEGGASVQLSANAGTSVATGPGDETFRLSDDGTTLLYSQVDVVERVFMIDVTTPGLPTKIVAAQTQVDPIGTTVPARGHLPLSLGFDFYP